MVPNSSRSLPVGWVAAAATLIVLSVAVAVLVASYNAAHLRAHSDSYDGPLSQIPTCGGILHNWMRGIPENYSRDPIGQTPTVSAADNVFSRFFTVILPWHLDHRPLLVLFFVFCEMAVLIGADRLRVAEKSTSRRSSGGDGRFVHGSSRR